MRTLALLSFMGLAAAASAAITLEPPPGWKDAGTAGKYKGVVIALKGPEQASFVVKSAPRAPLDNPAGIRGYLQDVLAGYRAATRKDYRSGGRVETRVFRNGITAQLLRAQLDGQDRLVVGVFDDAGAPHLAILASAAPEAMLPSLLGSVQLGRGEGEVRSTGVARSLDGQLELALGGGLRSRAVTDAERGKGFVLVIQGSGSEVLFQKLEDADATKPAEQGAIARELAAASAGVPVEKASPVAAAPTAAGPVGVYSWAAASSGEPSRIAAGYLPWCYWGYQLFSRGPSADELLVGALAALKRGPSADARLVASSPKVPVPEPPGDARRRLALLGAAAGAGALFLIVWSLRRKNGTLSA